MPEAVNTVIRWRRKGMILVAVEIFGGTCEVCGADADQRCINAVGVPMRTRHAALSAAPSGTVERKCSHCARSFSLPCTSASRNTRYCSEECRKARRALQIRAHDARRTNRRGGRCADCGGPTSYDRQTGVPYTRCNPCNLQARSPMRKAS